MMTGKDRELLRRSGFLGIEIRFFERSQYRTRSDGTKYIVPFDASSEVVRDMRRTRLEYIREMLRPAPGKKVHSKFAILNKLADNYRKDAAGEILPYKPGDFNPFEFLLADYRPPSRRVNIRVAFEQAMVRALIVDAKKRAKAQKGRQKAQRAVRQTMPRYGKREAL